MHIIERLRDRLAERHQNARDNGEKSALGWWATLQIVVLILWIIKLCRGK